MGSLLTSGAVARHLRISRERVRQLECDGRLRAVRDSTGRRLFTETEVRRVSNARRRLVTIAASGRRDRHD
jgi:predicted site-specific integrase-resolvase